MFSPHAEKHKDKKHKQGCLHDRNIKWSFHDWKWEFKQTRLYIEGAVVLSVTHEYKIWTSLLKWGADLVHLLLFFDALFFI